SREKRPDGQGDRPGAPRQISGETTRFNDPRSSSTHSRTWLASASSLHRRGAGFRTVIASHQSVEPLLYARQPTASSGELYVSYFTDRRKNLRYFCLRAKRGCVP